MSLTTIDQLRQCQPRHKDVTYPELGGTLRIKALSGAERFELTQLALSDKADETYLMQRMLIYALVDEQGQRMFNEETIDVLLGCDGQAVQRLVEDVQEFAGLAGNAVEQAKKN